MQNKKNRRQNTEHHRRQVRFEELLEDDRFDDEDFDSVTEDTLEFLSLDDDMIEAYQRAHSPKTGKSADVKARPVRYEEDDEDGDYEDDDYEDEDGEDDDYEDDDYEDGDYEDGDYEEEDYEDEDEDEQDDELSE